MKAWKKKYIVEMTAEDSLELRNRLKAYNNYCVDIGKPSSIIAEIAYIFMTQGKSIDGNKKRYILKAGDRSCLLRFMLNMAAIREQELGHQDDELARLYFIIYDAEEKRRLFHRRKKKSSNA